LKPSDGTDSEAALLLQGPALSRAGRELYPIVEAVPTAEYTEAFVAFLEVKGYEMIGVRFS